MAGALDPRSAYHAAARSTPHLRAVPDPHPDTTFGPQHAAITALISAVAAVSPEQDEAIEAQWFDMRGPGRFVARGRASEAASRYGRLEAQFNARQRAWAASALKCRDAAGDAAHALAVRDLIGGSFDRSAYDELVAPWAAVMGPVHPDDAAGQQSPPG